MSTTVKGCDQTDPLENHAPRQKLQRKPHLSNNPDLSLQNQGPSSHTHEYSTFSSVPRVASPQIIQSESPRSSRLNASTPDDALNYPGLVSKSPIKEVHPAHQAETQHVHEDTESFQKVSREGAKDERMPDGNEMGQPWCPQPPKETDIKDALVQKTKELEAANVAYSELMGRFQGLEKHLLGAQDIIFRLQPQPPVITAMEAVAEFKCLCATIEDWVQTRFRDVLHDWKAFSMKEVTLLRVNRFMSLVSEPGREAFLVVDSDEYNIISVIMTFLCQEIFQRSFWCPLNEDEKYLDSIEKSMQNLEPRRDFARIRTWRMETMIALVNTRAPRHTECEKELTRRLTTALRLFFPAVDTRDLYDSIGESIIRPTIRLAQRFQLSTDKFEVEWSGLRSHSRDVAAFDCQNLLAQGQMLKFPAAQANQINYVMDVCPGLYYQELKAAGYGEMQTLKKAKILVASHSPKDRQYKGSLVRSGRPVTLLGTLNEHWKELQPPKRNPTVQSGRSWGPGTR